MQVTADERPAPDILTSLVLTTSSVSPVYNGLEETVDVTIFDVRTAGIEVRRSTLSTISYITRRCR